MYFKLFLITSTLLVSASASLAKTHYTCPTPTAIKNHANNQTSSALLEYNGLKFYISHEKNVRDQHLKFSRLELQPSGFFQCIYESDHSGGAVAYLQPGGKGAGSHRVDFRPKNPSLFSCSDDPKKHCNGICLSDIDACELVGSDKPLQAVDHLHQ